MPGLPRDYLARHFRFLRWALNQQVEYDFAKPHFVLPKVGHSPSPKAELMATSANYSGCRGIRGKAETGSRGMYLSLRPGRADGALP